MDDQTESEITTGMEEEMVNYTNETRIGDVTVMQCEETSTETAEDSVAEVPRSRYGKKITRTKRSEEGQEQPACLTHMVGSRNTESTTGRQKRQW